jgi:hypothetical protein
MSQPIDKAPVVEAVRQLLHLAETRNTRQGLMTYSWALEELGAANSDEELRATLNKLYRQLSGINAHGYFTPQEQQIVDNLYEIFETVL